MQKVTFETGAIPFTSIKLVNKLQEKKGFVSPFLPRKVRNEQKHRLNAHDIHELCNGSEFLTIAALLDARFTQDAPSMERVTISICSQEPFPNCGFKMNVSAYELLCIFGTESR